MMSVNSNKRKTRIVSNNSKSSRPKALQENLGLEGIYGNGRFMHAAASLVGCVVQLQSRNGNIYEGVFRTFSQQMDIVLEMAYLVDEQLMSSWKSGNSSVWPLLSVDSIIEKIIFKLHDVVGVSAINVDLDYAAKDNFTDSAISKFNGQVTDKELEPWDGPADAVDGLTPLEGGEVNGWDANDMFQTNAVKYGVTTTYDNSLPGYTVKLEQKNTEEYKQQEAKAYRIAQEIQSSPAHQARASLENGNEEERFSAVIRPENNNNSNNRYIPQNRRKNMHQGKISCSSDPPPPSYAASAKAHQMSLPQHASSSAAVVSHTVYDKSKSSSSTSTLSSLSSPSPEQISGDVPTRKPFTIQSSQKMQDVKTVHAPAAKDNKEVKVNGELDKEQKPVTINPSVMKEQKPAAINSPVVKEQKPATVNPPVAAPTAKETVNVTRSIPTKTSSSDMTAKVPEKKIPAQKCRDDKTEEELKKFHAVFKLSEENQHMQEQKEKKVANEKMTKTANEEKETEAEKPKEAPVIEKTSNSSKLSTLNPNAEAFTPRTMRVAVPLTPSLMQPPRIQGSSHVVPLHHPIMHGLTQPIFATMTPQYVMPATPVSVSLASPFHATPIGQGPRFRKAVPMTLQPRLEIAPSHVAAATGPPILATAAIPAHQLAVQYAPSPGHHTPMGYPQAYSVVGPRILPPQAVGIMPPPHSYGDTSHLPPQLYMSPHPGTAAISTVVPTHAVPINAVSQGTSGPCSNASTPHSHAPSPVHQPPPAAPHVTPAHTPPTGRPGSAHTPQSVVYPGPLTNQHAVQPGLHGPSPGHTQGHHMIPIASHHPHVNHQHNYGVPSQQLLLMSQQTVTTSHPAFHGHPIHNQTASSHANAHNHVLQHTVIPTNATMVHTSAAVASTVYVQQHQGI